MLEKDDIKSFKMMFRGLGKNYKMPGKAGRSRVIKGKKGMGKAGKED